MIIIIFLLIFFLLSFLSFILAVLSSTRFPPDVFSPFHHPSDSFPAFARAVLPVKGLAMNAGFAAAL